MIGRWERAYDTGGEDFLTYARRIRAAGPVKVPEPSPAVDVDRMHRAPGERRCALCQTNGHDRRRCPGRFVFGAAAVYQ